MIIHVTVRLHCLCVQNPWCTVPSTFLSIAMSIIPSPVQCNVCCVWYSLFIHVYICMQYYMQCSDLVVYCLQCACVIFVHVFIIYRYSAIYQYSLRMLSLSWSMRLYVHQSTISGIDEIIIQEKNVSMKLWFSLSPWKSMPRNINETSVCNYRYIYVYMKHMPRALPYFLSFIGCGAIIC